MVKARYDAGLLFFNSSKWQIADYLQKYVSRTQTHVFATEP